MKGAVIAVSGIDTGVGKTFVTGRLAAALIAEGRKVITQKIVQTGTAGIPEDIREHRRLMGSPLLDADREGLTCPYIFSYPSSPHLAARLEGREIDIMNIRRATFALQRQYEIVILEGAGGLMVPLTGELLFADYLRDAGYPLLLVTLPRLGSINHTLLSIEACMKRGIPLKAVIYNRFEDPGEPISGETKEVIMRWLGRWGFSTPVIDLGADGFDLRDLAAFFAQATLNP
ncbi:MAG: ATP-dependent dethiobiotin synthetase BioD [Chlorobiaceae bacterium]|nr:ATP-dependent dethiobiotin synthetase BioD [Chlorobiaceae bacterium]NTW09770.1 ATP-dependent dethiobiotin synthetase BioD [Chlorobiaceae bacterium]